MINNVLNKAKNILFNNKNNGLKATNVQDAIDEVYKNTDGVKMYTGSVSLTFNNTNNASFTCPVNGDFLGIIVECEAGGVWVGNNYNNKISINHAGETSYSNTFTFKYVIFYR